MRKSQSPSTPMSTNEAGCSPHTYETPAARRLTAEILQLVRLNLRGLKLNFDEDPECDWKAGMLIARRIQRVLVDAKITPSKVTPSIFLEEVGRLALREDIEFEAYELIAQFDAAWPRVLCPEGFGFVEYAFALAAIDPHPITIPTSFSGERMRSDAERLARACVELQVLNERRGVGPHFYLAQSDAAQLLKRRKAYVGQLFKKLEEGGVLRLRRPPVPGANRMATVYQIKPVPFGNHNDLQDFKDPQ